MTWKAKAKPVEEARPWTFAEDGVCIDEYQRGLGWEQRASERLDGRTAAACMERGQYLHLRSSAWMRQELRRTGMRHYGA